MVSYKSPWAAQSGPTCCHLNSNQLGYNELAGQGPDSGPLIMTSSSIRTFDEYDHGSLELKPLIPCFAIIRLRSTSIGP
jgi:hypothetical protein